MEFSHPLVQAKLIRRYKRFLFDAELADGTLITGSCPNTGSMRGLTAPGSEIWLSLHDSPTRKYRHMLELVKADGVLVGINTAMPNRIAEEAVLGGIMSRLLDYPTLRREQRYGINSRIDLLLTSEMSPPAYVEVKNVHFMRQQGLAEFPDSVTARGAKHLEELVTVVKSGARGVMLYVIQRGDCTKLRICSDLDPAYAKAFKHARKQGVEAYALNCKITREGIWPNRLIAIDESEQAD